MSRLKWEDRDYQAGVSLGVLYPTYNTAVPWSGLTKVDEKRQNGKMESLYYEGKKFDIISDPYDFSAKVYAYTYPDVLDAIMGYSEDEFGIAEDDGSSSFFSMSYMNLVNGGEDYVIHLLLNVKGFPSDSSWETLTKNSDPNVFSWNLEGVPYNVQGLNLSVHTKFDSRKIPTDMMSQIETCLYGNAEEDASLERLFSLIKGSRQTGPSLVVESYDSSLWGVQGPPYLVWENGDGTFEILTKYITIVNKDVFEIEEGVLNAIN